MSGTKILEWELKKNLAKGFLGNLIISSFMFELWTYLENIVPVNCEINLHANLSITFLYEAWLVVVKFFSPIFLLWVKEIEELSCHIICRT